jgi:hypothetical protein
MRSVSALTVAALTAAMTVAGGATAGAQSPHQVDPAIVTPGLNPSFAPWSCFEAGTGITCQGEKREYWEDVDTGLICGASEVLATGREYSRMTRWHDLDGRAVKTSLQTNMAEDFSLLGTGYAVTSTWSLHKHYVYPVPGDTDSRVLTESGAVARLVAPGQGLVYQDTGSVTYVPGFEYEVPSEMHGVHDRFDGSPAFEAALCGALT